MRGPRTTTKSSLASSLQLKKGWVQQPRPRAAKKCFFKKIISTVKYQDNQASGQFWICKWQKQTVSSGQCVRMNQLSFPSSCLSVRYSSREGTSTWPSRDWTPSPLSASRDEQRTMTHSPTKPAYSGGGSILQKKEIECWWRKTTDVLCIPTVGCQATPSHFFPCHIQFLKCLCLT